MPSIRQESVPDVALDDLNVKVVEGKLVFSDLMEYMKARKAVAIITPEELAQWSKTMGYKSMAVSFERWLAALPDDTPGPKVVPGYVHRVSEGFYVANSYSHIISMLANEEGQFAIGDDLHDVTYADHLNIGNATPESVEYALATRATDIARNIYSQTIERIPMSSPGLNKTATNLQRCPLIGSAGSNNFTYKIGTEEKRDRRSLQHTLLVTIIHSVNSSGNVTRVAYNTEASFRNNQKKGLIWKNAYIDTRLRATDEMLMIRRLNLLRVIDPCPFSSGCRPANEQIYLDGQISDPPNNRLFIDAHFAAIDIDSGVYTIEDVDAMVDYRFDMRRMRYDFSSGHTTAFWDQSSEVDLEARVGCSN